MLKKLMTGHDEKEATEEYIIVRRFVQQSTRFYKNHTDKSLHSFQKKPHHLRWHKKFTSKLIKTFMGNTAIVFEGKFRFIYII